MSNSQIKNITTFIRMNDYFLDNILPHVNVSIAGKDHWIYCCITPISMENPVVKQWAEAQDPNAFARAYLEDDTWTFTDTAPDGSVRRPYYVVGMSLSQLNYTQLCILDKDHCHSVSKLPSDRRIKEGMVPTKNPHLFRDPNNAKYIYFARQRELENI